MTLSTRPPITLSESEMQRIWEAALRVWARVPVRAQGTPEFNDALCAFGCEINDERVSFPEAVREKVLARIDESRQRNGPWHPAEVTAATLRYEASGQALHICDVDTNRLRPATVQDLADWSRLCDHFWPPMGRAHPTFIPQDVPAGSCDVHAFATIILNSSRPWRVSVYTAEMLPYFIELQALAEEAASDGRRGCHRRPDDRTCDGTTPDRGSRALDDAQTRDARTDRTRQDCRAYGRGAPPARVIGEPVFAAKCWYNSPFMITHENIKVGMLARELLGQPFTISTMPVAGIATPATLAGALVHITAEILGCNAIALALDDRLCGFCAGPLTFDMKTGVHTQTGPDVQLLRNACAQMGAFIFGGGYTSVGGPSTAAKVPGAQSMWEKALDTTFAILGGVRGFGSLGTLAFADVGSPVQLMLDLELMSHFERLLQGIQVDDDRLAEDLICEVAPRGAYYMETEHTARYYREELWIPELMDRRVPMAWAADPDDCLDRARAKAKRILAEAPNKCPLSEEQKAVVGRILAAADAQVAGMRRSV